MYLKSYESDVVKRITASLYHTSGEIPANLDTLLGWIPSNAAVICDMGDSTVEQLLRKSFGKPTQTLGDYHSWFIEDFEIKHAERAGARIWKGKNTSERFVLKDRTAK